MIVSLRLRLIILIILSAICSELVAQRQFGQYDIRWSENFHKIRERNDILKIIATDDEGFYSYAEPAKGEFKVSYFNFKPELVSSRAFKLDQKKNEGISGIIQFRNKKIFHFTYFSSNDETITLYADHMEEKTLEFPKNSVQIAERPKNSYFRADEGYFSLTLSSDSSKLLVSYLKYFSNKNIVYGFEVFDDDLNRLWSSEREINIDYYEDPFSYFLKNDGSVYLYRREELEKSTENPTEEARFGAVSYGLINQGTKLTRYVIEDEKHSFTNGKLFENEDGELLFYGFYSNEGKESAQSGHFSATFDLLNQTVHNLRFQPFRREIVLEGVSKRKIKNKEEILAEGGDAMEKYQLDHVLFEQNGGLVLVAQQYEELIHQVNILNDMDNFNVGTVTYEYGNILVISLDHKGNVSWEQKIILDETEFDDINQIFSYFVTIYDDKLHLLYTHEEDEVPVTIEKQRRFINQGVFAITTLTSLAEKEVIPLYIQTFKKSVIQPLKTSRIGNKLIFIGSDRLYQRVGILDLDERKY